MGRPINKKHIGDGAGKIEVTAVRFESGAEVASTVEAFIVSQRSTNKFRVTAGGTTEVVTLVNKNPGSLAASECCINVVDADGVTAQVTKLRNRTFQVGGASNAKWSRTGAGASDAVEKAITAITRANPAVVTSAAHGFSNGDKVSIAGVIGMTQVNVETAFTVAGAATNTFQLSGVNSSAYTAYGSGGTITGAAAAGTIVIDKQLS